MSVELKKGFENLTRAIKIDYTDHLVPGELTDKQQKYVDKVKNVIGGNIVGDLKLFSGKKNEEKWKEFEENVKKELEKAEYKDIKGKLEKIIKNWLGIVEKQIEDLCMAFIPVKDMPFENVTFRTVPMVLEDKKGQLKFELDTSIAYIAEIKCVVNRPTLFGQMKGEKPLFAPLIGEMDLGDFKLTAEMKAPLSENFAYHNALLESMDSLSTRNNVTRYHQQYQRHGEPICDFFLKDEDLMKTMESITSGMESKRITSGAAVCAIVIPHKIRSLVLVHDEKPDYEVSFEALLKLSASCFDSPSVKKTSHVDEAEAMTAAAPPTPQGPGVAALSGPAPAQASTPSLPVWTEDELAEEMKNRGMPGGSNLPVWTEDELSEEAKKRGLPTGLDYWTEEELEEEAKKSQVGGALNIPEWKDEDDLPACPKCGYTVRKGWDECPVCNTPLAELWAGGSGETADTSPGSESDTPTGSPEGTPGEPQKKEGDVSPEKNPPDDAPEKPPASN